MLRYTIDRFEGDEWAVLEDEHARTFRVPRRWVPAGAREGDVLTATEAAAEPATQTIRFELDPALRDERLGEAERRRAQLPRGPKGDISL
jgi:hypothetical protein